MDPNAQPFIHLCHVGAKGQHGPGPLLSGLAHPPEWAKKASDGVVSMLLPSTTLERASQGRLFRAEHYRRVYGGQLLLQVRAGRLRPGKLSFETWGKRPRRDVVLSGTTVFCTCAAPGSPKRTRPCHLELMAFALALSGWTVWLHGRQLHNAIAGWGAAMDMAVARGDAIPGYRVVDEAGQEVTPSAYGW